MKTLLFTLIFVSSAYAGTISCQYNFGNDEVSLGFIPSSKEITREFNVNGLKYKVHVENIRKPNEVNDYIVIENDKKHRITYALECETAKEL